MDKDPACTSRRYRRRQFIWMAASLAVRLGLGITFRVTFRYSFTKVVWTIEIHRESNGLCFTLERTSNGPEALLPRKREVLLLMAADHCHSNDYWPITARLSRDFNIQFNRVVPGLHDSAVLIGCVAKHRPPPASDWPPTSISVTHAETQDAEAVENHGKNLPFLMYDVYIESHTSLCMMYDSKGKVFCV